ncbi:Clathrin light chain [Fusarium solani]|uniref:Clathrin light chain n=1 Tax=Fusarium solani TaxID=169388 RepID=A0A9P9GWD9_FUSSL|nr:clathrin light chain [Fusarium solani]KAH7246813.1 clathrin light chain [Fusarium solani]KAJ4216777.1 Clathrin light chain [Fusarium solani]
MADRFPSLEDFDSGAQTDIKDPSADPSTDDFLAREKALLGDDADQFATNDDAAAFVDAEGDLLGSGGNEQSTFESQFPDLTQPDAGTGLAPGGTAITGPSVSYNSGYQAYAEEEEEPEVIKEWRERRDAQIAKRVEQFAAQREETIKEAQQNIDDFYDNYNNKKEKGIAQTRKEAEEFLANQEDTVSGGTSWDRIAKLVDVSGKGTKGGASGSGKERFRELLVSLRKDEKAPGATGY